MKSKLSPKKIAANRRNARRSTGPRTPAGKNKVKWNALRHGLLSRELLFPGGESRRRRQEYGALLAGLRRDLAPRGRLEEMLVESIAVCYWRLGRVLRCEGGEIRKAREREGSQRRPGYSPADAIRAIFGIQSKTAPNGRQPFPTSKRVWSAKPRGENTGKSSGAPATWPASACPRRRPCAAWDATRPAFSASCTAVSVS